MIRMAVLGSGSGGNATLLSCGKTNILIDAGLSAKQISVRMMKLGVNPEQLDAILLTHEHSDHARGVDVFLRSRDIPVYANAMTREALSHKTKSQISWKIFRSGQDFTHGDFTIKSFLIPHDAAEPVGFVIHGMGTQIGMLSDVGHVTRLIKDQLRGCNGIYVEANYDEELLEMDTKRPWSIKQRIQSQHGHLSNLQTADLLHEIACDKLKLIMLSHLSSDCNCPTIAKNTIEQKLTERGLHEVSIHCAHQQEPSAWLNIGQPPVVQKTKNNDDKEIQEDFFLNL